MRPNKEGNSEIYRISVGKETHQMQTNDKSILDLMKDISAVKIPL